MQREPSGDRRLLVLWGAYFLWGSSAVHKHRTAYTTVENINCKIQAAQNGGSFPIRRRPLFPSPGGPAVNSLFFHDTIVPKKTP